VAARQGVALTGLFTSTRAEAIDALVNEASAILAVERLSSSRVQKYLCML
jgi:hypothetical protein